MTILKLTLQPSVLSALLIAVEEVVEPENDVSLLLVALGTAITDVTSVVMPDAAATSTARVVGRQGGVNVCNCLLDMKSRIGCGPQYDISASELLLPVIWTCCEGHWMTQGSILAGGHSRGCWYRWPATLGALMQTSSMASKVFLNVVVRFGRCCPAVPMCSAGLSKCTFLDSPILFYLCWISKCSMFREVGDSTNLNCISGNCFVSRFYTFGLKSRQHTGFSLSLRALEAGSVRPGRL